MDSPPKTSNPPPQQNRQARKLKKTVKKVQKQDRTVARGTGESKAYVRQDVNARTKSKAKNLDNVGPLPELPEKSSGSVYLPVTDETKEEVWNQVILAMKRMENLDYEITEQEEEVHAYGMKYYHDTFMLARTRLVLVDGQLNIEMRRLEGDGFAFSDEFRRELQESLDHITDEVEPQAEPQPLEENEEPSLMYLDLSDEMSMEIIPYWLESLRPGPGMVYDQVKVYSALSSLGWNCTDDANLEVLAGHAADIVDPVTGIMAQTQHLPTAYFGAVCLSKFAEVGAIEPTLDIIRNCCSSIDNWANPENMNSLAAQQVTRSREILRLLVQTILTLAPNAPIDESEDKELYEQTVASLESVSDQYDEEQGLPWDFEVVREALQV